MNWNIKRWWDFTDEILRLVVTTNSKNHGICRKDIQKSIIVSWITIKRHFIRRHLVLHYLSYKTTQWEEYYFHYFTCSPWLYLSIYGDHARKHQIWPQNSQMSKSFPAFIYIHYSTHMQNFHYVWSSVLVCILPEGSFGQPNCRGPRLDWLIPNWFSHQNTDQIPTRINRLSVIMNLEALIQHPLWNRQAVPHFTHSHHSHWVIQVLFCLQEYCTLVM